MQHKTGIALEIALQTHVLQICPVHHEIFCDDDVDPSAAFALTDLLSETIGSAPSLCPMCEAARGGARELGAATVVELQFA